MHDHHISEGGQAIISPFPLHRIFVYITMCQGPEPLSKVAEREPSSPLIPLPANGSLGFRGNETKAERQDHLVVHWNRT